MSLIPSGLRSAGGLAVARWAWLGLVLSGMVFFVAHTLGVGGHGLDRFSSTWVYDALEVLAVIAVAARAVLIKTERLVWSLLALGIGLWTLGDLSWNVIYAGNLPFPSVADVFYLAFYPPAYLALALLVRHRISRFNASIWFDGVTVALVTAAVGAAILLEVVIHDTHGTLAAEAANLAYPVGDIVLVALVVAVYALSGGRPGPGWAAIGGALALSAVADGDLPLPDGGRQLRARHLARRALARSADPACAGRVEPARAPRPRATRGAAARGHAARLRPRRGRRPRGQLPTAPKPCRRGSRGGGDGHGRRAGSAHVPRERREERAHAPARLD